MARSKKNRVSVLNWMGTLLLCCIPGVNIIAAICFLIFGKSASKRTFAGAVLLWALILAVVTAVLLLLLPDQAAQLADTLRETAAQTAAATATPAP